MSDVRHLKPDVWQQTLDIRRLIAEPDIRCLLSNTWNQTSEIRHLTSDVGYRTPKIRGLTTHIWNQTFEIRCLKSDNGHQASDIRDLTADSWHQTSEISTWHQTSDIRHLRSDVWQTDNWPAPNVSGFIAQLVEHRTGIVRSQVQTPLKSWIFFQASLRNCINCVHCDNHFFIFIIFFRVCSFAMILMKISDQRSLGS